MHGSIPHADLAADRAEGLPGFIEGEDPFAVTIRHRGTAETFPLGLRTGKIGTLPDADLERVLEIKREADTLVRRYVTMTFLTPRRRRASNKRTAEV